MSTILGLAIAKRAVERAGSAISLESGAGEGTTVTISLPRG
jgi:signal transduction histidine kinase